MPLQTNIIIKKKTNKQVHLVVETADKSCIITEISSIICHSNGAYN